MTSSALLIIGAGGHGRVVADAAASAGWTVAGFLDDGISPGTMVSGIPVLGPATALASRRSEFNQVIVAVGDATTRLGLIKHCMDAGLEVPVLVHQSAVVSSHAKLGAGTVVLAQAAINSGARIGMGVILNTGATVDHDCVLGDGVHVCPGAHLAGDVEIGKGSWIGIGSCVREGTRIGASVTVGAGSTVVADIADRQTVMGVRATARATV